MGWGAALAALESVLHRTKSFTDEPTAAEFVEFDLCTKLYFVL